MSDIPKMVKIVMDAIEHCLDYEEILASGPHGRRFTATERGEWEWIDDAIETTAFKTSAIGLSSSTHRYLDSLLRDYTDAIFPEEIDVAAQVAKKKRRKRVRTSEPVLFAAEASATDEGRVVA